MDLEGREIGKMQSARDIAGTEDEKVTKKQTA
jgi:hypothetical protein